ncbi:Uncharacterised protein [Mycobacterium tuberculosis]|nr:Uncharacterised protein [Mycobacterium tuberculosis]
MCGARVFGSIVHLPFGRVGDPMHRVGHGATGPAHIGCVEDDSQRSGHVGAAQPARRDILRLDTGAEHFIDCGLLETVQQLTDGFIHPGDAGYRRGARNDAHRIGVVAGVVGLPQRVAAPPAPHVLVDHRHEVDRLAQRLAQRHEKGHIRGMQLHGLGVGVARQQGGDRLLRIIQQASIGE